MVSAAIAGVVARSHRWHTLDGVAAARFRYQNPALLGTVVDLSFDAVDDRLADSAGAFFLAETTRLQAVFNVFDETSELARWCSGALPGSATSDELAELMTDALFWHRATDGIFNPLVGELSVVWAEAETAGREPDPDRLLTVAASIAAPRFELAGGRPEPTGDCRRLNLNAIAKGWIVERALSTTVDRYDEIDNLLVNAGGDLRHHGSGRAKIGIENPARPFDNEPPLAVIEIANEAVATSGGARRSFRVGGRRVSHVLDPRSGQPAESATSASVLAGSAAVADVMATVAGVLAPAEAVAFVDGNEALTTRSVAALIVAHDGALHRSRRWPDPT